MREILFRGRPVDSNRWEYRWEYGYYVKLYDPRHGREHHCIYTGYAESDCEDLFPDWYEVDRETVGQYTGLTDKDGKKIFEGDIIKTCGQHSCFDKVEFLDELAGFYTVNDDIHIPAELATLKKNFIEVIGNIHDNPELLEE